MVFFTPWPTWVKLTFVLGCSICIVFVYSIGVRYLNQRKLKKHTIRIAMEIAERGEMIEEVRRSDEVPFGLRAIERGHTVEGVWNSKTSTPLQTPSSSKAGSPVLKAKNLLKKHKRESSLSTVSGLDIPEPAFAHLTPWEPRKGSEGSSSGNVAMRMRNDFAEVIQDLGQGGSMGDHLADGPGPALYIDQSVIATTHGLPQSGPASRVWQSWPSEIDDAVVPIHPDDSASQVSNTHGDVHGRTKYTSLTRRSLSVKEAPPMSRKLRGMPLSKGLEALEHMNAHRRSHAAETGQLIPRARRHGGSGDFSGLGTTTSESGNAHSPARSVSWPMSTSGSHENSSTPKSSSLPPKVEDTPIRILAKTFPLPPLRHVSSSNDGKPEAVPNDCKLSRSDWPSVVDRELERRPNPASLCVRSRMDSSKPCPSSWTDKAQDQINEVQRDGQGMVRSPLTDPVISHHNTTTRMINPGFEVHPVGALGQRTPVKKWGDAKFAPVDTSDEVQAPRKPQKRDRSRSSHRRTSSEREHHGKENGHEGVEIG